MSANCNAIFITVYMCAQLSLKSLGFCTICPLATTRILVNKKPSRRKEAVRLLRGSVLVKIQLALREYSTAKLIGVSLTIVT